MQRPGLVVICFKFSNFAYANTVGGKKRIAERQLLFALNLVTLLMQIQSNEDPNAPWYGCYLL